MTSKERVRLATKGIVKDRVPAHYSATDYINETLLQKYGFTDMSQLYNLFQIDLEGISVDYLGPNEKRTLGGKDYSIKGVFGEKIVHKWNGREYNSAITEHPLDGIECVKDVYAMKWPGPNDFDYAGLPYKLEKAEDRAVIIGTVGNFQAATRLLREDDLYADMAIEPEISKAIFDRLHAYEMDHYERILKAGKGQIDILRVHDDYGTQQTLLFSREMWKQYFYENTKELVALAHSYGAIYQQHSCGAIGSIIDFLVECNVDGLEPIQPVKSMDPETLYEKYEGKLYFCGGIDTQFLLPEGDKDKIAREVHHYIDVLGRKGYILYPSQSWDSGISLDTIEYFYQLDRTVKPLKVGLL
jgi:uroporphyrinogen decarboxylase